MESSRNHSEQLDSGFSGSNVELTLLGMEKKWVRYEGAWMDKSMIPLRATLTEDRILDINEAPRHWWQFWKS